MSSHISAFISNVRRSAWDIYVDNLDKSCRTLPQHVLHTLHISVVTVCYVRNIFGMHGGLGGEKVALQ